MSRSPRKTPAKAKIEIDPSIGKKATGSDDSEFAMQMLKQVGQTYWLPEGSPTEDHVELARASIAMLQGIAPKDELEGMLAAQMVATHNAALDCFRRAMIPSQTFHGRDNSLKNGAKLAALYVRQIEALNKHRGKGQQKVTVEHVHVESGGQAIVGNVETSKSFDRNDRPHEQVPKSIAHQDEKTLNLTPPARKKVRQRRKT